MSTYSYTSYTRTHTTYTTQVADAIMESDDYNFTQYDKPKVRLKGSVVVV